MRLSKKKVNEILDLVWDWTDYDCEGNKYVGYDVYPSLDEKMKKELGTEIVKIIAPKKKWWKLWNTLKKS